MMKRPRDRKVPCDTCTRDLADNYKPDSKGSCGWVAWLERDPAGVVYDIGVFCVECYSENGLGRHKPGSLVRDMPVEWSAGHEAISNCWRLMRDYKWEPRTAERMHDIFKVLQHLPTWKGQSMGEAVIPHYESCF